MDKIPGHSLFSQNRKRRFEEPAIFREIFNHIIILCIEKGIVTGETVVSDGTLIHANVSSQSIVTFTEEIEKSAVRGCLH